MSILIAGLALFIVIHLVPTLPDLRARLVAAIGPMAYKIAFSLISLVGLVLIVKGFGHARGLGRGNPQLWVPPVWSKHLAWGLMLPSLVLLVASNVPSRIRTATKHPMLLAIKLWALAHLLANGDLAGVVLFGSLLAWVVWDRVSVGRRAALGPLGHRHGTRMADIAVLAVGIALWAFMLLVGHAWLIGLPLLK
jgi:uncharacterized membrane protein